MKIFLFITFISLIVEAKEAVVENCSNCHSKKNSDFIVSAKKTIRKHTDKELKHGKAEISCGSCHDRNNFNFLRTSEEAPTNFTNPSPVCKQCHNEEFSNWADGIHGKTMGGWNRPKTKLQCIECHSPHAVLFKKMKAEPPPQSPRFLVPKHE